MRLLLIFITLFIAVELYGQDTAPGTETEGVDVPALVDIARDALSSGDYAQAIDAYEQVRKHRPDIAEAPYNMGVAAYRLGEYERASEFFEQAMQEAADPELRNRAAYNLGTTAYAQSLQQSTLDAPPTQPMQQMEAASEQLQQALDNYRTVLDASPTDQDARANAELANRRLRRLQEMQEQMQQQQQQQNQSEQSQDEKSDEQQQSEQNQPSPSDQQQQSEQQQNQEQPQQQQPQQSSENQEERESESQQTEPQEQNQNEQQPEQQQQQSPSTEEPNDDAQNESAAAQQPRPVDETMTEEEAERLLQRVRDRERQRREQLARREAQRQPPVEKDW